MPKEYVVGDTSYHFPDDYTDSQVQAILKEQGIINPPAPPGFLSNLGTSAMRFAGDVLAPITHPIETLEGVTGLVQGMAEKSGFKPVAGVPHAQYVDALGEFYKNRYGSVDAFKNALYTDPVGVAADISSIASLAGLGAKGVQVAGRAARLGKASQVAGQVAKAADAVSIAANPLTVPTMIAGRVTAPVAEATADLLRRSALKGGYATTAPVEEVRAAAQAMKEQRTPFSQKGLEEVGRAAEALRTEIGNRVQAATQRGVTIDPNAVQLRADELRSRWGRQVNPTKDLRDIEAVQNTFSQNWPGPIPAEAAQELKVGSGQQIGGKYGQASAAQIEAEKALTRGLKEELERQIPELASLNAKQSKLINLEDILGKALNKYVNSGGFTGNLAGQFLSGTNLLGGGIGLATGHGESALAAVVTRALLSDPKVKTFIAIKINQAQQLNPAKWGSPRLATALSRVEEYQRRLQPEQ